MSNGPSVRVVRNAFAGIRIEGFFKIPLEYWKKNLDYVLRQFFGKSLCSKVSFLVCVYIVRNVWTHHNAPLDDPIPGSEVTVLIQIDRHFSRLRVCEDSQKNSLVYLYKSRHRASNYSSLWGTQLSENPPTFSDVFLFLTEVSKETVVAYAYVHTDFGTLPCTAFMAWSLIALLGFFI